MNLDSIKNNTTWEDAANSINSNFNKTNLELTKIAASSVKHKGYFTTEAALLAAQPSPKVGDNAYVGATYPGVVYICNTAGMWTATTTVPSPPAVNISEYYKKTETDAIVATVESNINSLETNLNNSQAFLRGGLPMVLNTSSLMTEVSAGRTLTSSIMSNFLLDFKLEGTGEAGCKYGFGFQYHKTGTESYSNYLYLYKYNSSNVRSVIGSLTVGNNAPIGRNQYNFVITSGYTYLTKATVYLNYDALGMLESATSLYSVFELATYNFDQTYLFDLSVGPLAEEKKDAEVLQLITEVEALATQADGKMITEETTTWELANDLNFFTTIYSYFNLGQYTKILTEAISFSQVRLNLVSCPGSVQYKVCIVSGIASIRDCPVGPISPSTHTIIKEGTLALTTGYNDYLIDLGDVFACPAGSQVAIYMVPLSGNIIDMRGTSGGAGNPEKTSNVALISVANNPFDGGNWGAGSVDEQTNLGYFNVALSLIAVPLFVTKEELGNQVQEQVEILVPEYIKPNIELTIPDKVYAVVGTELNLWNDTVSLSVDKGLSSPLNYQVKWYCTKGLITDRCFRFTPIDSDVGTVTCTCYIYDMRGSLIDSKTFSIVVAAKNSITVAKNIVYFGDSLGSNAAGSLYENFNNIDKFTGTKPTMRGTRGTTVKYEAVGGYTWAQYATSGQYAYRIQVTDVTSASVGATYSLNSYSDPFTIREVNIVDGTGNMLVEYQYGSQVSDFPSTGTMNKLSGAGDDVINFTGGLQEPNNPLWNATTNELDIALYKTRIGLQLTDKIDAVSFQFGINDHSLANDLTTLMTYINDLYNAFMTDNQNCKFIIGLTTSSGNDLNGSGANYGASQDWLTYQIDTYKIRQFYLTLQNSVEYPNIVIAPIILSVDRYYGYDFSERAISQRVSTIEKYHNNYVHPASSGYGQIGDVYFGTYIYSLSL